MIYLVYLLSARDELAENPMPMRRGSHGQLLQARQEYVRRWVPELLGAYQGETAGEAVAEAASDQRRFGQYVAVEGALLELDFSAKDLPALPASAIADDDAAER